MSPAAAVAGSHRASRPSPFCPGSETARAAILDIRLSHRHDDLGRHLRIHMADVVMGERSRCLPTHPGRGAPDRGEYREAAGPLAARLGGLGFRPAPSYISIHVREYRSSAQAARRLHSALPSHRIGSAPHRPRVRARNQTRRLPPDGPSRRRHSVYECCEAALSWRPLENCSSRICKAVIMI
jgi:hypothetical protein